MLEVSVRLSLANGIGVSVGWYLVTTPFAVRYGRGIAPHFLFIATYGAGSRKPSQLRHAILPAL